MNSAWLSPADGLGSGIDADWFSFALLVDDAVHPGQCFHNTSTAPPVHRSIAKMLVDLGQAVNVIWWNPQRLRRLVSLQVNAKRHGFQHLLGVQILHSCTIATAAPDDARPITIQIYGKKKSAIRKPIQNAKHVMQFNGLILKACNL